MRIPQDAGWRQVDPTFRLVITVASPGGPCGQNIETTWKSVGNLVVRGLSRPITFRESPLRQATCKPIIPRGLVGNISRSLNQQPWSFIIIKDRATLQELGGMIEYGPYVAQAAFAVAVVIFAYRAG